MATYVKGRAACARAEQPLAQIATNSPASTKKRAHRMVRKC